MSIQDDYLDPDRHLWGPQEEPESYSNEKLDAWTAINELYGRDADNRNEKLIERDVYKYTDCGAWIAFEEDGILLGSIVEGSDVGCESHFLAWRKVTQKAITERLDAIETEADAIWQWANEDREDGQTDADAGLDFPG